MGNLKENVRDYMQKKGVDHVEQPAGKDAMGHWPAEATTDVREDCQKFIDAMTSEFQPRNVSDLQLLDAGSGNGLRTAAIVKDLASRYPSLTVHYRYLDQDVMQIPETFEETLGKNVNLDVKKQDITKLDLQDGSIHGTTILNVLGWLPSVKALNEAIGELHRVIVPKGVVLANVMSPFNLVGIENTKANSVDDIIRRDEIARMVFRAGKETGLPIKVFNETFERNILLFTENAVRKLFEDHGFRVTASKYYKNDLYPNGFSDQYPENVWLIAGKH